MDHISRLLKYFNIFHNYKKTSCLKILRHFRDFSYLLYELSQTTHINYLTCQLVVSSIYRREIYHKKTTEQSRATSIERVEVHNTPRNVQIGIAFVSPGSQRSKD